MGQRLQWTRGERWGQHQLKPKIGISCSFGEQFSFEQDGCICIGHESSDCDWGIKTPEVCPPWNGEDSWKVNTVTGGLVVSWRVDEDTVTSCIFFPGRMDFIIVFLYNGIFNFFGIQEGRQLLAKVRMMIDWDGAEVEGTASSIRGGSPCCGNLQRCSSCQRQQRGLGHQGRGCE